MPKTKIFFIFFIFSLAPLLNAEVEYEFRNNMRHTGNEGDGWELRAGLELPASFKNSASVLGITDGYYIELEGQFKTALHYHQGKHDWSNSLFVAQSYIMTPSIKNTWIKERDILKIESRYLYNLTEMFGLFAHANFQTSLFKSVDYHDSEKDYEIRDVNDENPTSVRASELKISDPFKPLFFEENLGVFAVFLKKSYFTWEARTAISFRQTIADGQKVFVEEKDDTLFIRDLQSFYQIGPTAGTTVEGKLFKEKLLYTAGVDVLWPFWQNPGVTSAFKDNLIYEISAGAAFMLNDWAALSYTYTAEKNPRILEKFQQQHEVNLTLTFQWLHNFSKKDA